MTNHPPPPNLPHHQLKSWRDVLCTWSVLAALSVVLSTWLVIRFGMSGGEPDDSDTCLEAGAGDERLLLTLVEVCTCVSDDYVSDSFYNVSTRVPGARHAVNLPRPAPPCPTR